MKRFEHGATVPTVRSPAYSPGYVALGIALFGAAALEALLLPGEYRAVARVAVSAPRESKEANEPFRLSRRLEEVTLDQEFLGELTRAHGFGSDALSALSLRRAIGFLSADGTSLEVSFTDPSPERARVLCNLVAERAVERASSLFPVVPNEARASARLLSASTHPTWPTREQGLLLGLGALLAAVFGAAAVASRLRRPAFASVEPSLPLAAPELPLANSLANSLASPAATLKLIPREEPQAPALAPLDDRPAEPPISPAPRTEPLLPPPTPKTTPHAGAPERSYTPMGIDAQPRPLPLRRSTLILGSPVAPSPIPWKPTPTSFFRPSPIPEPPPVPRVSPSSHPPPSASANSPNIGSPSRHPLSSKPPPVALQSQRPLARTGARYSYVSTPVPAPHVPTVDVHDVPFVRDPTFETEKHKPWRRQLYTLGVAQCFVTAFTSVGGSRRDKARFAVELGLCLAETGHARVLLVEADLREPQISALLGVNVPTGQNLEQQLSAVEPRKPWSVLRCEKSLHVLVQQTSTRPELILGEPFRDCVIALSASYDFVLLNGPAAETGLAGSTFTGWVDGVIIVAEDEQSSAVATAKTAFGIKQLLKVYSPHAPVR